MDLKRAGVDEVVCVSVNDILVEPDALLGGADELQAWLATKG